MNTKPIIGSWYGSTEIPSIFEVVAYSDVDNSYEIQLFEGEIAELDEDNWDEMSIYEVSQPEDWSGALEIPTEDLIEYLDCYRAQGDAEYEVANMIEENFKC
ncbi:MAG: hypothetical protein HON32_04310 [Francisellaceae bacterium]|nr:hypothetical protein [Francisellaceae bacterium]MBT6539809.1 hypothetical protein [Francisellaceae bacterium]